MFRAAKDGSLKVVTANDLRDGRVVFLDAMGGWTRDIARALVLNDGPELDAALAHAVAQQEARIVVEPYAVDVAVTGGVPVPARLRERIRAARGPTTAYGDAERVSLTIAGDAHV